MILKEDGGQRPLGIPTLRDRVAQMAVKLIIEPIFEADFCPHSYGFRPKKSAHDAVDDIANTLWAGYTQVIDADLSKYFDSIPHAKLRDTKKCVWHYKYVFVGLDDEFLDPSRGRGQLENIIDLS